MGVSGTNPNLYPWVANDATDKTDPTGRDFGHHWFPRDELKWALTQGLITQDAYWVGFGYYSGELNAAGKLAHGSPIGHPGYNNEVREMVQGVHPEDKARAPYRRRDEGRYRQDD